MERIAMKPSLKDIPVPERNTYLKLLIAKVNSFVRRMRWNVYYKEEELRGE